MVEGSKGGFCLAWKVGIDIVLRSFSKNHIDVLVRNGNEEEWHYTGFYRSLSANDRAES